MIDWLLWRQRWHYLVEIKEIIWYKTFHSSIVVLKCQALCKQSNYRTYDLSLFFNQCKNRFSLTAKEIQWSHTVLSERHRSRPTTATAILTSPVRSNVRYITHMTSNVRYVSSIVVSQSKARIPTEHETMGYVKQVNDSAGLNTAM